MGNGSKLSGPDGQPLSSKLPIIVIKSRKPLGQQLIQHIGQATKCCVIVLPLEIDLVTDKLAMEEIEAIHGAIHDILEIEKTSEEEKGG